MNGHEMLLVYLLVPGCSILIYLSLSVSLQHIRHPHILHAITRGQPCRTHSVSVNIYKRSREIPCMVNALLSYRYLPELLKELPCGAESTFHGGSFQFVLHKLSTCFWKFTCRIKSSHGDIYTSKGADIVILPTLKIAFSWTKKKTHSFHKQHYLSR